MRNLILPFVFIFLSSVPLFAQNVPDRPLITVRGQGEIKVIPDEVVISVFVSSLDKNLATAKKLNDEKARKVLALTKTYQIAPENVQTDFINISSEYRELEDKNGESKGKEFLGYRISKKIVVAFRTLTQLESLLSDLIDAGVSSIGEIDFRTTQLRKFRDEARSLAIKAAQEKAIALTKEINQWIGKAYSITEEQVSSDFSNGVGISANGNRGRSSNYQVDGSTAFIGSTVAIGQISITATVTVSFELK